MNIHPGDIIYCRVRGNTIVLPHDKWDGEIPFEIIGLSSDGFYILYVPKYYSIRHSWEIEQDHIQDYDIDKKYKKKVAIAVQPNKISKVIRRTPVQQDGMLCIKCGQFHYMAEANQSDGTLICYSSEQIQLKWLNISS